MTDEQHQQGEPDREPDEFDLLPKDSDGDRIAQGPFGLPVVLTDAKIEDIRRKRRDHKQRAAAASLFRDRYVPDRKCPKCGLGAGDKLPGGKVLKAPAAKWTSTAENFGENGSCGAGEAIIRQCRNCTYQWGECPVDTEPALAVPTGGTGVA